MMQVNETEASVQIAIKGARTDPVSDFETIRVDTLPVESGQQIYFSVRGDKRFISEWLTHEEAETLAFALLKIVNNTQETPS